MGIPPERRGVGGTGEGLKLARPSVQNPPQVTIGVPTPPPLNLQRPNLGSGLSMQRVASLDRGLEPQGGASEVGDLDRSTVHLRAVNTKVPQILQPILTEILKSQPKKIFSGNPTEFPSWKKSWDSFADTLKASVGGGGTLPDKALLRILEGWLDEASQKQLQTKLETTPDLPYSDFMVQLCQEFDFVPKRAERNKWRTIKLQREGDTLKFAEWRKFKASLQESLVGVETPLEVELREHILQQLPRNTREAVVKKEIERSKQRNWVSIHFPPNVSRAAALEIVGDELGLRIRDLPNPRGEDLSVDCHTEALAEKAVTLDGLKFTNAEGREVGTLTIHRLRSLPMGTDDLLATIDALAWGEYEVQRMTPTEENQPKSSEKSQVRKVESSPNPQSPKESSGKGAWSKSPPSMGGGRGRESRARSTTPTPDVCYTFLRDGRPAQPTISTASAATTSKIKGRGEKT